MTGTEVGDGVDKMVAWKKFWKEKCKDPMKANKKFASPTLTKHGPRVQGLVTGIEMRRLILEAKKRKDAK